MLAALSLTVMGSVLTALPAHAAGRGLVTTDFAGPVDRAEAVAVQPDGKIVVAGQVGRAMAVARYNPNGSLDSTFGSGRKVTQAVGGGAGAKAGAFAVVIQPDGRIVLAGSHVRAAAGTVLPGFFMIVRYNPDGMLDTSFGTTGIVRTGFNVPRSDPLHRAYDLAILGDGWLLAVGMAGARVFAAVRYEPNGLLDTSFGNGGTVTTEFAGVGADAVARAAAVRGDGRIVAAGQTISDSDFALAQYNQDGSLDGGFGQGGLVRTDFAGGLDLGRAIVMQPDGRVVVAGFSGDVELARYNANGSLDAGFGRGGKVTTDIAGQDEANGMGLLSDGRIVIAGRGGNNFALARYNSNGSLDGGFGNGGKVTTDFAGGIDFATAMVFQPDGRIIAVGRSGSDFAVARYNPNGSLDTTFG